MTYDDLLANGEYSEIASVNHTDIKDFIVAELVKQPLWARVANMYQIAGLLAFMLGTFKAFMPYFIQRETSYLWWLLGGIVFTFSFLIVIHELIHALAYKYVGAKYLSFGMNIRKFLFYVQADKEVLNYQQFRIVALAPAVLVAVGSILAMAILYQHEAFYFFIPIFAFHSLFCSGDFGLLSFFSNRCDQDIVTFDIKAEGKTYFYAKSKDLGINNKY